MGGSSKLDKLKALQKESKKGIVVDKTFGLKNKKGKKAQDLVKQVARSKQAENESRDKLKTEKKLEELRTIFPAATDAAAAAATQRAKIRPLIQHQPIWIFCMSRREFERFLDVLSGPCVRVVLRSL